MIVIKSVEVMIEIKMVLKKITAQISKFKRSGYSVDITLAGKLVGSSKNGLYNLTLKDSAMMQFRKTEHVGGKITSVIINKLSELKLDDEMIIEIDKGEVVLFMSIERLLNFGYNTNPERKSELPIHVEDLSNMLLLIKKGRSVLISTDHLANDLRSEQEVFENRTISIMFM